MNKKLLICVICLLMPHIGLASDSPKDQIKSSFEKAKKLKQLPSSSSIVGFNQAGESVVVLDNPRWVVKGQLYDMWQNKKMDSAIDVQEAAKKIPIDKLEINTNKLLEIRVNPEKSKVLTVFLDPFSSNTSHAVKILTKYVTDHQLRFIFTLVDTQNVQDMAAFSCLVSNVSKMEVIEHLISRKSVDGGNDCDQQNMMNSFGLSNFLRITQSPTLIAPNDVFNSGMPHKLHAWLASNQE